MEINKPRANLEGWWVGNQKRARPCGLRVRLSSELPYLSLPVPRYPPWGPLAKVAATAAKPPAARPAGTQGRTCGPASLALRAPRTSVSATLFRETEWRYPGLVPANSYTITLRALLVARVAK